MNRHIKALAELKLPRIERFKKLSIHKMPGTAPNHHVRKPAYIRENSLDKQRIK